jgi:hypothetical protein
MSVYSQSINALEPRWIDAIHARMLVRYGSKWLAMYPGVDGEIVKADWAAELAGFGGVAIRHALDHLPVDFPPTASQFKALCLRAPEPEYKRLPAPKADPERVAKAIASIRKPEKLGPKAWAYKLREREKQGDNLTRFQRQCWREALATELAAEARTVDA